MGVYLSELMALNHEKDHVSLISHSLHTMAVVKYVIVISFITTVDYVRSWETGTRVLPRKMLRHSGWAWSGRSL